MNRKIFVFFLFAGFFINCRSQQRVVILVSSADNQSFLEATILIKELRKGYSTDTSGSITIQFPGNGIYTLKTSAVGFTEKQTRISVPYNSDTLNIMLERSEEQLEEVIVQSTRTSRTIANVPTRIEVIGSEEIDEKNNMRPGNVAMLLHESTGIQVQQTSATSGNASIRMQGLDGRYTQLLKDGFPNYGNFSSGLSVLEIPPLDLKQVEIIKGPASPLFGGGAIAGVINFISRTPAEKPEYSFIFNHSHIGQDNIGCFASARKKKAGYSLLALYNRQKLYDVDEDGFTEVPRSSEFTLHPKLFLYPGDNTTIIIGNSLTTGKRTGGDIQVIRNKSDSSHQYFEENESFRNISTLELDRKLGGGRKLMIKQSLAFFDRTIHIPGYSFSGENYNTFTDLSYVTNLDNQVLVMGGNFIEDRFREKLTNSKRDNTSKTWGIYGQHTWDSKRKIKLESGVRMDVVEYKNAVYTNTEWFILPRVSLFFKFNSQWSSRIGAGMGYKTPTLFTEETETIQYRNVDQVNNVKSEKSYGGTADINYSTRIHSDLAFSINHMFFYTWIERPLVLEKNLLVNYYFSNANQPVKSLGFETNAKLVFKEHLKLFLGFTFTKSRAEYLTRTQYLSLVPKGRLNSALVYEKDGVIKAGLEAYFTGKQYLDDGSKTPAFTSFGFMAEKIFKKYSFFINLENFTDTRQSRYKNVVNGSSIDPTFDQIWTYTEGFVMNGGFKIRF